MTEQREKRLILEGSPCDTNYYDRTLLTVTQALERGKQFCPNYAKCQVDQKYCALQMGLEMAGYVVNGSNLRSELSEMASNIEVNSPFYSCVNNKREIELLQGRSKLLRAVEIFARTVLLLDTSESVLFGCEKCGEIKTDIEVIDSIHDGPFPLSGSGKTKRRLVNYCPTCESVPRGKIIEPEDDPEENFFRGDKK